MSGIIDSRTDHRIIEPHVRRHIQAGPRPIRVPRSLEYPARATMRYQSPLRYPGAKSGIAPLIGELIRSASVSIGLPQLLVEPFAGGASTSLRLAGLGLVDRVLLADADPLVARFWQVAAAETEWLIGRMWDEPVTLERWDYWRNWTPKSKLDREIAVKCLFLNRTTFSGILHGRAGPIGGRSRESKYSIDCRFRKRAIEDRLRYIGDLYNSHRLVDVWCKDWKATLADISEWYPQLIPNQVCAYLDPPYLDKSSKLYSHSFDPHGGYKDSTNPLNQPHWNNWFEHYRLAEYLRQSAQYRWILSYDHQSELLDNPGLYRARRMTPNTDDGKLLGIKEWRLSKRLVNLRYCAARTKRSQRQELLITTLPPASVPRNSRFLEVTPSHLKSNDTGNQSHHGQSTAD